MKSIGIDLGTTNSVVAYYDPQRKSAAILPNTEGDNLTPSVVGLRRGRDGGADMVMVGKQALNFAVRNPADTIQSVKRLMGRDFADPDVADARGRLPYQVVAGPNDDPRAHVVFGGRPLPPAAISAKILERLRADAGKALGEDVTHAVITVPAYFHEAQRAATREAGEQAGLRVRKIIDEPTAAAVAFGLQASQSTEGRRVLVYDLGGGTFDISILQTVSDPQGHAQFQILSYVGDRWLGGDDFDNAIADRIVSYVAAQTGTDPRADKAFLHLAKSHAEDAKRQLSQMSAADVVIPGAYRASGGPLIDVEMTISRTEFDDMIDGLVARTMTLVQRTLSEQHLTPDHITDVLLVGGATLTPKVYETVEAFFGKAKVRRNINPMECVALGAGILAGTLRGVECPECRRVNNEFVSACETCGHALAHVSAVGETEVHEVTGMALGIAAVQDGQRDVFVPIIPRGTPLPLEQPMRRLFEPTDPTRLVVPVYEGDDPVASRNAEQGTIEYDLPHDIAKDSQVEVSFNYDSDRVLTVTLSVPGTELIHTTRLRHDKPRSPAPSAQTVDTAADAKVDLERTELFTRQFLESYGPYLDSAHESKIRRDLEQAQRALEMSGPDECRRIANLLQSDVFNAGLATELYLADRATDGATPEVTEAINRAASAVRASHREQNREMALEQARHLKLLVAKALDDRQVDELKAAEDYDGLLKSLERP